LEIVNLLDMLNRLRESPEYELMTLSENNPKLVEEIAAEQRKVIAGEIATLIEEAARLQSEIEELSAVAEVTIA